MEQLDELKETNAAVDAAIDKLGDVVRNEASELRQRFDAIGNAYAGGLGPEAVSEEIERGKARLSKLNAIAEAVDALSEPLMHDEEEPTEESQSETATTDDASVTSDA